MLFREPQELNLATAERSRELSKYTEQESRSREPEDKSESTETESVDAVEARRSPSELRV